MKIVALLVLMATVAQAQTPTPRSPHVPQAYDDQCYRACWSEAISVVVPRGPDNIHLEVEGPYEAAEEGTVLARLYSHAGRDAMKAWVAEIRVNGHLDNGVVVCGAHDPAHKLDVSNRADRIAEAPDVTWLVEHAVTPLDFEPQRISESSYAMVLRPEWHCIPVARSFDKKSDEQPDRSRPEPPVPVGVRRRSMCDCAAWFREASFVIGDDDFLLQRPAVFWRCDLGTGDPTPSISTKEMPNGNDSATN